MSSASPPFQDEGGGVSVSPVPAIPIIPTPQFLMNGSSYDMNVDGSGTAQNFDYGPAAGITVYAENLTFGLDDGGNAPAEKYGALTALTNGVQIIFHLNNIDYTVVTLKNNGDIVLSFNSSATHVEGGSFLNFSKGFIGKMVFATAITLNGDLGDYVRFKIQDNLTGILWQRASVQVWKERI